MNIRSTANHEPNVGNGARFWVLSSKLGKLHSSELFHASKQIDLDNVQLAAGDALDFVVDINGDLNTDQYLWEIQIEQTAQTAIVDSSEESKENPTARWNSKEDFTGPIPAQLNAWEQFVQVLLLSNEFYFVP